MEAHALFAPKKTLFYYCSTIHRQRSCITSPNHYISTPRLKKVLSSPAPLYFFTSCPPYPPPTLPLSSEGPPIYISNPLSPSKQTEYSILLLGLDNAGKTTLLSTMKSLYHPSHPTPANKTVPTVGQNVCTIDLPDMYLKIWDVGGQHALRGLWTKYYGSCHAIVFVIDSSDVGDGELDDALLEEDEDEDEEEEEEGEDENYEDEGEDFATDDISGGEYNNKKKKKRKKKKNLPITSNIGGSGGAARDDDEGGRLAECALVLSSVLSSTSKTGIPVLVLANKQDREDCVETVRIKEGFVRKVFEGGGVEGAVRDSRVLPVSALKGTGVREAVEWVRTRVKWNKEGRPPVMR